MWFIRWYLKNKIAYLERMMDNTHDHADTKKDGRSADYWHGKRDGLWVSLVILCNREDLLGKEKIK